MYYGSLDHNASDLSIVNDMRPSAVIIMANSGDVGRYTYTYGTDGHFWSSNAGRILQCEACGRTYHEDNELDSLADNDYICVQCGAPLIRH